MAAKLSIFQLVTINKTRWIIQEPLHTLSASKRALLGVPTPIAISLTPDESNFSFDSFNEEASSQLYHHDQKPSTTNKYVDNNFTFFQDKEISLHD
jgi:hypothetical protein